MTKSLSVADKLKIIEHCHVKCCCSPNIGNNSAFMDVALMARLPIKRTPCSVRQSFSLGLSVKVRDVVKLIEADGWRHVRTSGSHRQYQHPIKAGTVTAAGKPGSDVPTGTLKGILKQAPVGQT
ncbi:MAG: type II toxin-antitoxin system HicA family toxin [Steroidobacterales bacterium]